MPGNSSKGLILIVLLLLSCAGCSDFFDLFDTKDKYYPLEDKYKIKFEIGDTLTYLDGSNNSFQLVISKRYDKRTTSRKGSSGPYNIIDREHVYYDSVVYDPNQSSPVGNIYTVMPDGNIIWTPSLYTRVGDPFYEKITLNSRVYYSVYEFVSNYPIASNKITKWYYSHHDGFVGFELSTGQLFTLITP